MIARRGVYCNVASPLDPLTVHAWSDARWDDYLATLARAGINQFTFYLWQDHFSDYAAAPERVADNRRLHERMRFAIRRARRHGMRTGFLLAPTFVPQVLWKARPELHADIEYVRHGFSCVCPSRPASWDLMQGLFAHEWEWFRDADLFQLWFYDPGGCMCAECRADLCAPLVRQADVFSRMLWRRSPKARLQISFWPVWAWEAQLGVRFGERLLDRLAALFGDRRGQIGIVDTAEGPGSFCDAAKARGFQAEGFLFSANVETPFCFLHPQPTYLERTARHVARQGWDGAFVHALYPGPKALNTVLAARFLAEPDGRASDRVAEACRLCLGDDRLAGLVPEWERIIGEGGDVGERAAALSRAVDAALGAVSRRRAAWADPVRDSARALAALTAPGADPKRFRAALEASGIFRGFAAQGEAEFGRLTGWLRQGWNREHF